MKLICLNSLNCPIDDGAKRTKEEWLRRAKRMHKRIPGEERFVFTVTQHYLEDYGRYFRLHFAAP